MKKKVSLGLIVAVALSFSGCGFFGDQSANIEQASEEYAEKGPVWDQGSMQKFLERESKMEMSYAGPFYFGSFDGVAPLSKQYSEQRRSKADEIIAVIDEGIDVMVKLDKKLREERDIFATYIKGIQEVDKSTKGYTDQVLGATKGPVLSEALSSILVMRKKADGMEQSAEWGFLQFQKYGSFVELTDLYTAESASLMARATSMYYLLEADSNSSYKDLNANLMASLDPISEEVSELVSELYYLNAAATYGKRLLFTTDYHFAKESIAAADVQIAEAKTSIAQYDGSNELLSPEMVALLQQNISDIEEYRNSINLYLESIPSDELLSKDELAYSEDTHSFALIPVAKAQMDVPGWFQNKVKSAVKTAKFVKDMSFAAVRVTGKKIKDAYDESGAHEAVKDGAQIINSGLEMANSTVEVTIHGIQGIYYGDMSWEDFKKKIDSEKKELHDRFVAGTLGKDQYDELIHQVDLFQASTKRFVEDTAELTGLVTSLTTGSSKAGKFVENVTKSVGNEAKGVLDTATDFSKNLAIVMHPETTKQQTREAMLNIYIALQGAKDADGKLVKVELPDVTDITKQKALEEAAKELGLSQEQEKEFKEQLKEMFQSQLKEKETQAAEKTDNSPTEAETEAVAKILNDPNISDEEAADLIIAEILKGLPPAGESKKDKDEEDDSDYDKDGIENEYDNCERVSNPEQTDTDLDGLGDACDPDCSGDKDGDEVCDEIDNCPADSNADQKDSDDDGMGNMCDFDPPHISEIAGSWPGTITVREVYVSDELRAQATADGCDIESLEESKDVPKPVSMNITPTSETGGTIFMSADGDAPQEMPFTYINGVLTAAQEDDNGKININMNFNRSESSGAVDVSYMGGQATLKAELDVAK